MAKVVIEVTGSDEVKLRRFVKKMFDAFDVEYNEHGGGSGFSFDVDEDVPGGA